MTRITLASDVLAPLATGLLLTIAGPNGAAITAGVVCGWFALALPVKLILISRTALKLPAREVTPAVGIEPGTGAQARGGAASRTIAVRALAYVASSVWQWLRDWRTYISQPVFLASSSFAFAYLILLSPGNMLNSWLVSQQTPDIVIGLFRAISAVSGLMATFVAQWAIHRIGAPAAGIAGVLLQLLMLVPAVICFVVPGTSVTWFLLFIVLSRMGLWAYDIAEVQIMQEGVPRQLIGAVNSTERSLQKMFELASYVTVMIWHDPAQFSVLVFISCASIATSAVLFCVWHYSGCSARAAAVSAENDAADAVRASLQASGEVAAPVVSVDDDAAAPGVGGGGKPAAVATAAAADEVVRVTIGRRERGLAREKRGLLAGGDSDDDDGHTASGGGGGCGARGAAADDEVFAVRGDGKYASGDDGDGL